MFQVLQNSINNLFAWASNLFQRSLLFDIVQQAKAAAESVAAETIMPVVGWISGLF